MCFLLGCCDENGSLEIGEALVKAGHYAAADIRRSVLSAAPKVRRLAAAVLERRKVLSKTTEKIETGKESPLLRFKKTRSISFL